MEMSRVRRRESMEEYRGVVDRRDSVVSFILP